MMAETVIFSVILLISAAPIIIIGIVQYRSKDPVGFGPERNHLKKSKLQM